MNTTTALQEFEEILITPSGGRMIVTGQVEVEPMCDCFEQHDYHPHVIEVQLDSTVDMMTDLELMLDDDLRLWIEHKIEAICYRAYNEADESDEMDMDHMSEEAS